MPERKLRKEDLVVLRYATNVCFIEVVTVDRAEKDKKSFSVNLKNGTWGTTGNNSTREIGENSICPRRGRALNVIGVYDRRKIEDLDMMVKDIQRAMRR